MAVPFRICNENVNDDDRAIQCDICNFWAHIKYNIRNYIDYKYLQGNNDPLALKIKILLVLVN